MSSGEIPDKGNGIPLARQPKTGSALRLPQFWFVIALVFGFAIALVLEMISRTQLQGHPLLRMLVELCVVTAGLLATLVGAGWGSAIAFQRSSQDGLWYVLFPPYLFIYAIRHWREAGQPTLLFMWGLSVIILGLLAMVSLREQMLQA